MSKFWYPIRIFWANVFKRPLAAISAVLSLLLLFFLLELIWVSMLTVQEHYKRLVSNIEMEAFFDESLSDSTITDIRQMVFDMPEVGTIEYISKESARLRLLDMMGADLLDGLENNPLPRSLVVSFKPESISADYLSEFSNRMSSLEGVVEIHYPGKWLSEVEDTQHWLYLISLILGAVILLTSALNIVHAVRLTVRVRQDEIKQMRYLGSGPSIITQPFLLEGVIYALMAIILSWGIIIYLQGSVYFEDMVIMGPAQNEIFISCMIAILMGMAGGYIGAKRSV